MHEFDAAEADQQKCASEPARTELASAREHGLLLLPTASAAIRIHFALGAKFILSHLPKRIILGAWVGGRDCPVAMGEFVNDHCSLSFWDCCPAWRNSVCLGKHGACSHLRATPGHSPLVPRSRLTWVWLRLETQTPR
ncbi:hypothetical protein V2G26_006214 [Clonostachys chloroleuca]